VDGCDRCRRLASDTSYSSASVSITFAMVFESLTDMTFNLERYSQREILY
jgi:hypothetical protein